MKGRTSTGRTRTKKGLKLGRALRTAAMYPVRGAKRWPGMARNTLGPKSGEEPFVILRVQVIGCNDLLAKDRGGTSDPFVSATFGRARFTTPVAKKTLSPTYPAADATFDFPVYLSLADNLGGLELLVWDKDLIKKDYLGEVSLSLEDWFKNGESGDGLAFDHEHNYPFEVQLLSTRNSTNVTGTIKIKLGFAPPSPMHQYPDYKEIYQELVNRANIASPTLVSAPPTEGIGTIRSHMTGPAFEDDGLSSDEDDEDDEGEIDTDDLLGANQSEGITPQFEFSELKLSPLHAPGDLPTLSLGGSPAVSPKRATMAEGNVTVTEPTPIEPHPHPSVSLTPEKEKEIGAPPTKEKKSSFNILTKGIRRPTFTPRQSSLGLTGGPPLSPGFAAASAPASEPASGTSTPLLKPGGLPAVPGASGSGSGSSGERPAKGRKRPKFKRSKASEYNFNAANDDILGIVMLEIVGAENLPRLKNMTRTGWDMDPFVVLSFGKKVFRTRVIRHSLNPKWDEKLLFHVRRHESQFSVQLSVLDWDKLTSNDHIGDVTINVGELLKNAPKPDPETGLYAPSADGSHDLKEFRMALNTGGGGGTGEGKEGALAGAGAGLANLVGGTPHIAFKAKYQPYAALRQQFWRHYLKQYDADDTNTMSMIEVTSMLDSLGSTLSKATVKTFFERNGKDSNEHELSIDEMIQCLEKEVSRPRSERKSINLDEPVMESGINTPTIQPEGNGVGSAAPSPRFDKLDFSGPALPSQPGAGAGVGLSQEQRENYRDQVHLRRPSLPPAYITEPSQQPVLNVPATPENLSPALRPQNLPSPHHHPRREYSGSSSDPEGDVSSGNGSQSSPDDVERVINVKTCPLCHRPRLNSKAEMDIVTHIAVCASQDWNRVDRIVVGNFVTPSQAQRKWLMKVISKVSSGAYQLGANSANIIVQNRLTGQLEEEKMQVYIRLGIRLLYKGARGRMEGARARRLLKSLSVKQGKKFDSPDSAAEILPFLEFHKLNVSEIRDPLTSFKNFNEFFYRKLKDNARPVTDPDDPTTLVSCADCRMMSFETVTEATKLWIKGRDFTVQKLLGDAYAGQSSKYIGGALGIFRLAPQDYHRFHSPVDGVIGPMTYISGEYYTVNPQAVRTGLDVYGENARKIVPIDSPTFGRVMAVCVGAMMVGSILTTVKEGEVVTRGQEFGYFAFGGSTIVLLFEKDAIEWDEDLLINSRACLETLVRVGMGVGKSLRPAQPFPSSSITPPEAP